jgi:hypothetical protein
LLLPLPHRAAAKAPWHIVPFSSDERPRSLQVPRADAGSSGGSGGSAEAKLDVSEVARQNLKKAASACRRYGWLSFWVQLVLNTVAAVVLLFSLAFTSQARLCLILPCLALCARTRVRLCCTGSFSPQSMQPASNSILLPPCRPRCRGWLA